MIDNTEDTLVGGMSEETKQSVLDAAKGSKKSSRSFKAPWKKVAIGGVSGIMLGVASAFAADHVINGGGSGNGDDDGLKVATKVDDDQSFKEAFNTAHEEVGPGGMFEWHGNVYSTYSEQEWDALPTEEQNAFNEKLISHMNNNEEAYANDDTNQAPESSDGEESVAMVDDQDDDIKIIGADDSVELAQNDDVYVVEVDDDPGILEVADNLVADITDSIEDTFNDSIDELSDNAGDMNVNMSDNMENNYLADNADGASSSDDVFMA